VVQVVESLPSKGKALSSKPSATKKKKKRKKRKKQMSGCQVGPTPTWWIRDSGDWAQYSEQALQSILMQAKVWESNTGWQNVYFYLFICFGDKVSLSSPDWNGARHVDQAGHNLGSSCFCLLSVGVVCVCHHILYLFFENKSFIGTQLYW
jgi:hypothetical protein